MKSIALAFLISCSAFADLKISNRTSNGGQSFNSTILMKAGKIRTESPGSTGVTLVTLQDCSAHKLVEINDRTRSYLSLDMPANDKDQAQAASASGTSTGEITITVNQQDTGERKTLFGYPARHLKGTISTEGNGACNTNMHTTTDGWYIDIPDVQGCGNAQRELVGADSGCQGGVTTKVSGVEKPGFPVVLDTTLDLKSARYTTHQETTQLSTATLDPSLFEVPAGYTKVDSYRTLMGFGSPANSQVGRSTPPDEMFPQAGKNREAGPALNSATAGTTQTAGDKKKGALRIGVAQVTSIVSSDLATDGWQRKLVNDLNFLGAQGVALNADPNDRDATLEEAKERNCDYVVLTIVTNFKSVSVGEKIGSVLGRGGLGGVGGSGQGRVEISAEAKIFQPDNPVPILDGNNDFRQNDADATANGLLHTEARDVMLQLRKLQSAK